MKSRLTWELIVIGIVIIGFSVYQLRNDRDRYDFDSPDASPPATYHGEDIPTPDQTTQQTAPGSSTTDTDAAELAESITPGGDTEPLTEHLDTLPTVSSLGRESLDTEALEKESPSERGPSETTSTRNSQVEAESATRSTERLGSVLNSVGSTVEEISRSGEFNDRFQEGSASLIAEESFPAFALASVNVHVETGHLQLVTHSGSDVIVQVWVEDRNQSGEFQRFYSTRISKNPESVSVHIERRQRDEHWTTRLRRLWATDVSNSIAAGVRVMVPEGGLTYTFHTHNGNIEAFNAGGDITLETRAGNMILEGLFGRVVAETRAGNIRAERISGTTALRTRAGNITADYLQAHTELRTRAGNIQASVVSTNHRIDVESRVGNIRLRIPETMRADLSMDGSSVSLDEAFNLEGEKASQYIRGTLNGGGPLVRLHSRVGNATLHTIER